MTDRVDETTIRTDDAGSDARTAEVPTVKSGEESGSDSGSGSGASPKTAGPARPPIPPPPSQAPKVAPSTAPAPAAGAKRPVRRARLRLTRVDPWSVMKTAFLLSIAFAVVTVVAVAMVWQVLGAAGVWDSINSTIQESIGGEDVQNFQIEDYVGTSRVLGFTMLVAAIDVVLLTAAATLTAFLYNMSAALLGGVEVTLAEDN